MRKFVVFCTLIKIIFFSLPAFSQAIKEESIIEVVPQKLAEEIGEKDEMPEELRDRRRRRESTLPPSPPPRLPPGAPPAVPSPVSPTPSPIVATGSGTGLGMLTLLFEPLNIKTQSGQTVEQKIFLSNPRGIGFDELEIFIKFDPESLSVLDGNLAEDGINLALNLTKEQQSQVRILVNKVENEKGEIKFKLKSNKGNIYLSGPIATIRWIAKKKNYSCQIKYQFNEERTTTKITARGQDLLGAPEDPKDGVISASISITE